MKRTFFFLLWICAVSGFVQPVRAQNIEAGSGKQEITPPIGTPLGGYGKRHGHSSEGILDPLYARALALRNGEETFVFISADQVLVDAELREEVLLQIRKKFPLKDRQLMLAATHSHSGAGAYGSRFWEKFILGKKRADVFKQLSQKIADSAVESLRNLSPAETESAEIQIDDLVENRMDPALKESRKMRILRFKTKQGEVTGHLIFIAAHPTLLSAGNLKFSADFPGVLCSGVEKQFPGSTALLINGAAGDLRPRAPSLEDRHEKMLAYGRQLLERFEKASFHPASVDGLWQSVLEKKKLPPVKARLGKMRTPSWLGGRVFARESYFQSLRMGNFLIFAFPGELTSGPGHEIENHLRARGLTPLIAGYANDYIAYVVSPRYYRDRGQYEARVSFYGPGMSRWTQETAIEQTEQLLTETEKKQLRPEGSLSYDQGLPVIKLRGDAYHIGYEEGRLLKKEIHSASEGIETYLKKQLPVPLAGKWLIHFSMDRAWKKMEPFISYEDFLQIKGLADGAGIPLKTMERLHALPEVYPSWCTNGAYWGKATKDGRMIALRNLDWNRGIGIHRDAAVKFIEKPGRQAYVNLGYAGFSGVLSGMNDAGISLGQIGAVSKDESLEGTPMPFLIKEALENASNLESAKTIFETAARTRGYNYVAASAEERKAFVFETTHSHFAVFGDNDPNEKAGYALRVPCAVFRGDPALDPEIRNLQIASGGKPDQPGLEPPTGSAFEIRYQKHGRLAEKYYGEITPKTVMEFAKELAPGSNIQSAVFAFPEFWIANADDGSRAADSEYHHFDFENLKK